MPSPDGERGQAARPETDDADPASDGDRSLPDDWEDRHARITGCECESVVRAASPPDDWQARHGRTPRSN